jgi:glycosyltransferase involved in cell wall biosynthesis
LSSHDRTASPRATVVITTKDRREDLREALVLVLAQTEPIEVLVIDDGSSDDTAAMVVEEFSEVRLERSEQSLGLITQRNRGAALASAPVVFSIDDDARLVSPLTVEQTLDDFDHPRIGAVAIPFVDVRRTTTVRQVAPDAQGRWIAPSFIGTAHAIRRRLFLELGGYRDELVQMGEEPEFCLRLLNAGYVTRLGRADKLHHLESPKRDTPRIVALGRRNDLLHAFWNVPLPYLPGRLAKVTVHSVWFAAVWRQPRAVFRGLAAGYREGFGEWRDRQPVSRSTYKLDHDLRKRGPVLLEEIEGLLPAPQPPIRPKTSA